MKERWGRTGLRTRVTLLAGVAIAVALLAGAVLLVAVLRSGLTRAVDDRARQRVDEVVRLVVEGRLPTVLPAADPSVLVQVLDASGAVVAATPGTSRVVVLVTASELSRAVRSGEAVEVRGDRVGYGDGLRVVADRAGSGGLTVVAAVPDTALDDPLRLVQVALLVGLPLLLAAGCAGVYVTVGRTLRPVGALRSGAAAVTAAEPARRLPVPAADDEIRRLAETLNGMLDRLEAGGTRQRSFVADAAHELRSPLAALRTTLEVAVVHPDAAEVDAVLHSALADVLRMGRLVEDLLLLARQGASARPPRRVDAVEITAQAVEALPGRPAVTLVLPGAAQPVLADRDALGRIVRNLVENALRHAASSVTVTVTGTAEEVVLEVLDDGPGIAVAERARVFERFTRLDSPRSRDSGGSGLGLAIVRELVAGMAATVEVDDGPGGGALLRVRLPAAATVSR